MARILVTDGEQRAALALVRSLGRAGHRVTVTSASARPLAAASRHCAGSVRTPDPLADPPGFRAALLGEAERGYDVLLPVTEAALVEALDARRELPARIPFPEREAFLAISDKARLAEAARACGIAVPDQARLEHAGAPLPASWTERPGPVVIKPTRSVVRTGDGARKLTVRYAASGRELGAALAALPPEAFPVLLQERVSGAGIGVFLLRWDGETRAVFGHERLREKPPSGGVSVLRRSVDVPPDMRARCEALLEAFDWQGVAMVELKRDALGVPRIMEVNGRFWGSLQLAIDAGVDFPALLVDLALGRDPGPPPRAKAGVVTRWFWGDVDHLLAVLRRRGLPPGDGEAAAWSRAAAVGGFLRGLGPGVRSEVWSFRDPRPFARETWDWLHGR